MCNFALILPAAGKSLRFGVGRNKLTELLDGCPVLIRSLRVFLDRADLSLVVIPTNDLPAMRALLGQWLNRQQQALIGSPIRLCSGGEHRAASVQLALLEVPESIEWVAVHDAARPLITPELIDRTLALAMEHGAAVPALPVQLTIKQAAGPLPAKVQRTVPRQQLWAMQTPQIMRRTDLLEAYARCPLPLDQITDDVQLLELDGKPVWLVPGDERNIKITTTVDLQLATALHKNDAD